MQTTRMRYSRLINHLQSPVVVNLKRFFDHKMHIIPQRYFCASDLHTCSQLALVKRTVVLNAAWECVVKDEGYVRLRLLNPQEQVAPRFQ